MRASVSACTCIVLPDLSGSGQQIVWAVGAKLCAIGQRISMLFGPNSSSLQTLQHSSPHGQRQWLHLLRWMSLSHKVCRRLACCTSSRLDILKRLNLPVFFGVCVCVQVERQQEARTPLQLQREPTPIYPSRLFQLQ